MRWNRRFELPADARSALGLQDRERVLAAARLTDGSWAAATPTALLRGGLRLDWVATAHAMWDHESSTLQVEEMRTGDGQGTTHFLALDVPGLLPEVVFERVTASIVASRHVPVQGRAGLRVVVRRAPGQDELVWQVVHDRGLDETDPRVAEVRAAAITDLRRELGAQPPSHDREALS